MASKSSKKSMTSGSTDASKVKRQIETMIRGKAFTPSLHPRSIVGQPWNNLTAICVVIKSTEMLGKDLGACIGKQCGLYTGSESSKTFLDIEYRVLSVAAWSTARHITIFPQDLVSGTEVELTRVDGSQVDSQYARAGYVWPASNQSYVLDTVSGSTSSVRHVINIELSTDSRTELQFKVLWRSARTMKLTQLWDYVSLDQCRTLVEGCSAADVIVPVVEDRREETPSEASSIDDVLQEVRSLRDVVAKMSTK